MSQEEQRENLIEAPNLEPTVDQSLKTPFFTQGEWPKACWWHTFGSDQLNQWIDEAIAQNPSIQSVRQKIEQAKERATQARAKLYPLVYFDADGNWEFVSKQGIERAYNPQFPRHAKIIDLTLSFNYEFDFWDKYRNLFRAALSLEKAEQAELAQIELITATSLARTYFALKSNLAKERIYRDLYEVRKKIALLRQLLLDEAIDDVRILLLAEERVEEAKKWLYGIEEEVAITRHLINILRGKGPDEPLEVEPSLSEIPPSLAIPKNMSIDLLSRRPDLMAQIWRVEALAHEVGSARAHFFPNINLASIAGLSSTIYHLLFDQSSFEGMLLPTISLPVYTAGDIQANLDAKRAEFQSAVFAYNDLILKSAEEVVDTLVFARTVYGKKAEQEAIVKQALKRWDLSEMRLKSGLDNALQTLEQKEEVLQQELEDINLAYGRYAAAIGLIKAIGGGYSE
jgi:NodT family efflux transporter outer membrane factor (OMF) lipoprotein